MKTPKALMLKIDERLYVSTLAPETIDDMDGSCPACGAADYEEVVTISQLGLDKDDCITVMTCRKCYQSFHYNYQIESRSPLVLLP